MNTNMFLVCTKCLQQEKANNLSMINMIKEICKKLQIQYYKFILSPKFSFAREDTLFFLVNLMCIHVLMNAVEQKHILLATVLLFHPFTAATSNDHFGITSRNQNTSSERWSFFLFCFQFILCH